MLWIKVYNAHNMDRPSCRSGPLRFCCLDDFAKTFEAWERERLILSGRKRRRVGNPRIRRNRTFKGLATRGHSTMGWFFGFKRHVVMNHKGERMAVKITPGNTDDRAPLAEMAAGLKGKPRADEGYTEVLRQIWTVS